MRRETIAIAVFCALAGAARAQRIPDCPGGTPPAFTGHPFRPLSCEKTDARPAPARAPAESAAPDVKDAKRSSLKPLVGRWRGLVLSGVNRYEVELEISGSGRKHALQFSSMDYHSHIKHSFQAEVKSPLFSKGPSTLTVWLKALPEQQLSGPLRLGAAPLEEDKRSALDRAADVAFSGRPEEHRVQFALDGPETLRFLYTFIDARGEPARTSGELTRQR